MVYYHGNVAYKTRWHKYWWHFKYDIQERIWPNIPTFIYGGLVGLAVYFFIMAINNK